MPAKWIAKVLSLGESANHGEVRRAYTPLGTLSPFATKVHAHDGSWGSNPDRSPTVTRLFGKSRA